MPSSRCLVSDLTLARTRASASPLALEVSLPFSLLAVRRHPRRARQPATQPASAATKLDSGIQREAATPVGDMPKSPSSQYGLKAQEDIDPRGIRVTNALIGCWDQVREARFVDVIDYFLYIDARLLPLRCASSGNDL